MDMVQRGCQASSRDLAMHVSATHLKGQTTFMTLHNRLTGITRSACRKPADKEPSLY